MSEELTSREVRSFLVGRDPSIDPRYRPRPQNKKNLNFDETTVLKEEDESASIVSENSEESKEDTAKVYLRLRPINLQSACYNVSDSNKVLTVSPMNESSSSNKNAMEHFFHFSEIFEKYSNQSEVYNKCVQSKIDAEENFSLLTYGTSGSGKTFTLLGSATSPGIIPRALEHIFHKYNDNIFPIPNFKLDRGEPLIINDEAVHNEEVLRRKLIKIAATDAEEFRQLTNIIKSEHSFGGAPQDDVSVWVWISFLEIYNENVYDLIDLSLESVNFLQSGSSMCPPTRKNLKIICNDGKVLVKNAATVYVKNSQEAISVLRTGLKHVNYASTSINQNSSRSHCVFIVDLLKFYRSGESEKITYKFCDLAGSERLNKTGNVGSRLKEAQQINRSLLVLGRCLDAANNRKKSADIMIPFRESKLTMLLQAALLGREKLSMIVNLMPTDEFYEENMNVLNFASIAKEITYRKPIAQIKKTTRFSFLLNFSKNNCTTLTETQLQEEIMELRHENQQLLDRIMQVQAERDDALLTLEQDLRSKFLDMVKNLRAGHEEHLEQELEIQKRRYESKMHSLERQLKDLKEDYEELMEELEEYKRRHHNTANPDHSASVIALDESTDGTGDEVAKEASQESGTSSAKEHELPHLWDEDKENVNVTKDGLHQNKRRNSLSHETDKKVTIEDSQENAKKPRMATSF